MLYNRYGRASRRLIVVMPRRSLFDIAGIRLVIYDPRKALLVGTRLEPSPESHR